MKEHVNIEHKGIITEILPDKKILVSILSDTGCASCSVKGACSASEVTEKIIEIKNFEQSYFNIGQNVTVYYKQSLGFRALFLAYVLPFIILFSSLIVLFSITKSEGFSGLISISMLIPYFVILYFSKNKIKETFSFSIKA